MKFFAGINNAEKMKIFKLETFCSSHVLYNHISNEMSNEM